VTGPIKHFELCLVTDRSIANGRSLLWIVAEAVKGGVTLVQLRDNCVGPSFDGTSPSAESSARAAARATAHK
jgi:thiamine monophosphate synthase